MKYLYRLNYPENWDAATPVAIALHGMGTDYHDLQPVLDEIAPTEIQISVQGDLPFQQGYMFFKTDFVRGTSAEQDTIGSTVKNVHDFICELLAQEGLNDHPLHYLGFSQGAILGTGLVTAYPDLFDQVELFSGRLPQFIEAQLTADLSGQYQSPRIFISQGLLDPLFHPEVGRHLNEIFSQHFSHVHYHEYQVGHGIAPQTLRDVLAENQNH